MFINRQSKYLGAWIACIALLFASVLSSVFHSSMARKSAIVSIPTEICSTSPVKHVVMVDVRKIGASQDQHDAHGENCAYCRFQADSPGLPPMADLAASVTLQLFTLPSLFYQSPRPLFAWASAQPRAPPYRF
jgi:hypothetical protein